MNQCVVIIGEAWDVAGHRSIDMLRVAVVFKVFVISEYSDRVWGADKEMILMLEATYKGK